MRRALARVGLGLALGVAGTGAAQSVQDIVMRNSFNPFGAGARGLGMGGAFIAVADDGTASSFNPAGLAQLRRSELAVVGFAGRGRADFSVFRPDGSFDQRSAPDVRHGALDFVGLAVPFHAGEKNLTVNLSYQRAVDLFGRGTVSTADVVAAEELFGEDELSLLGLRADQPILLRSDIAPAQTGAMHTLNLAAAYQLTERMSLGLTASYWIGRWTASGTNSFRLEALRPDGASISLGSESDVFRQRQELRGFNVSAGVLLRFKRVNLGGIVRLPFNGDYRLDDRVEETDIIDPPDTREGSAISRIRWPLNAGVGVALRPLRGVTLAADVQTFHWSRTVIEDLPDGLLLTRTATDPLGNQAVAPFLDRNFFDLLPAAQTSAADTRQFRAGAEYLLTLPGVVIPLRAGVFRERAPVVDLGSDQGRRIEGWTCGTGLNFRQVVLDVSFERRRSNGVVGLRLAANGDSADLRRSTRESVSVDRLVASLIYRPGGDADPLTKLFRFLFVGGDDKP